MFHIIEVKQEIGYWQSLFSVTVSFWKYLSDIKCIQIATHHTILIKYNLRRDQPNLSQSDELNTTNILWNKSKLTKVIWFIVSSERITHFFCFSM